MLKRCKVVMLPTNEKSYIKLIGTTHDGILSIGDFNMEWLRPNESFQHLYITSNDEISKGDWFIYRNRNVIKCHHYIDGRYFCDDKGVYVEEHTAKIIATTDNSLLLPRLSAAFVKKFVINYSSDNRITEVLIKYDTFVSVPLEHLLTNSDVEKECLANPIIMPIVDSNDNTIFIHKARKDFTRDEVVQILRIFTYNCLGQKWYSDYDGWISNNV